MKNNIAATIFPISAKDPKIIALLDEYELHPEEYIEGEMDALVRLVQNALNQWERVVLYAYAQNHSIRKLAAFFGVKPYYARKAIGIIKAKTTAYMRQNHLQQADIAWL